MKLTDKQLIESGLLGFTLNDFHEVTVNDRVEQILIIDCPYFKAYDGHKRWVIHKTYYDNEKYELINYEYFFNNEGISSYLPLSFLIGSDITFSIVTQDENKTPQKKGDIPLLILHNETGELIRNPQIFDNNSNNDVDKTIKQFAKFFMDFIFLNIEDVEKLYEKYINEEFEMSKITIGDAYYITELFFPKSCSFVDFDPNEHLLSALQTLI